jgi:hypothetical protein
LHEQTGQPSDFFEREDLFLVDPGIFVKRHTVGAAVIAPVRDGYPQVP